jgi:hypothetical protein
MTLARPSRQSVGILDAYSHQPPSAQSALDIFAGEWASRFPPPFDGLDAGQSALFADGRVRWALAQIPGGVAGKKVLELGPLEGGHTYMLDRAGAADILAIEANSRAYLKCLISKELLGMPAACFRFGDFVSYLQDCAERFDVVMASGVLYHMIAPVELIARIAGITDTAFLWTHYYDADALAANPATRHRVVAPAAASHRGFAHALHRYNYDAALDCHGFCGGSRPFSHWLTREGVLGALRHFGLSEIEIGCEERYHPNGPAFCIVARRPAPDIAHPGQ